MSLAWAAPIAGGILGLFGQSSANSAAAASVDKQIEFQREMASTQHQREVADLKAAGLNPILSAGGAGAAAPSGASFQPVNTMANFGRDFASAGQLHTQSKLADSTLALNDAAIKEKAAQVGATTATTANINADTLIKLTESQFRQRMLESELGLRGQNVKESNSRIALSARQQAVADAQVLMLGAQAGMFGTASARNLADIDRLGAETALLGSQRGKVDVETHGQRIRNEGDQWDIYHKRNEGAYQRDSNLAPFLPYVRNIINSINPFSHR